MINTEIDLVSLNKRSENTLVSHLGIELTELGTDYICGKMPVDNRTKQPIGMLHGGASLVLAETLGSIGSSLIIDMTKYYPVGLEINGNHLKSATSGYVTGKASVLHAGKRTHVWEIKIRNEKDELVCVSRLTVAIIERK
jgi:1,4-dihydroxy-2-naphthoyl-CoA hydrolase